MIALCIVCNYLFVSGFSRVVLHINDKFFCLFTDVGAEVLFQAFVYMPTLVVQTKIIPKNIEGTMFALFMSLGNLANGFVSPMFGATLATWFGVDEDDFSALSILVLIQFGLSFLPMLMIPVLPTNKQIAKF